MVGIGSVAPICRFVAKGRFCLAGGADFGVETTYEDESIFIEWKNIMGTRLEHS
jgi:hypothetical protein